MGKSWVRKMNLSPLTYASESITFYIGVVRVFTYNLPVSETHVSTISCSFPVLCSFCLLLFPISLSRELQFAKVWDLSLEWAGDNCVKKEEWIARSVHGERCEWWKGIISFYCWLLVKSIEDTRVCIYMSELQRLFLGKTLLSLTPFHQSLECVTKGLFLRLIW